MAQLLTFAVAGEPYAIPVDAVREVVDDVAPRAIPGTPPWLQGLVSRRGELVAVCDLAARLGLDGGAGGPLIVVGAHGEPGVGVRVQSVRGVADAPPAGFAPLPVGDEPLLAGIAELGGELVIALDLERLAAEVAAMRAGDGHAEGGGEDHGHWE